MGNTPAVNDKGAVAFAVATSAGTFRGELEPGTGFKPLTDNCQYIPNGCKCAK
jgi:hypothetical protein